MSFFWPNPDRRRRALPLFWHSRVESRRRKGIVDVASDDTGMVSVVLWDLPGTATPIAKPLSMFRALGRATPRVLAASRRIDGLRPKHPHLYLACGGTLPHARAKGVTARLVRARIEASAVDVFTIATNDFSATLAEHDGFRATGELAVTPDTVLRGMLLSV